MNKKYDKFDIITNVIYVILFIIAFFLISYIIINKIDDKNNKKPLIRLYSIISPSMAPEINVYDVIVNVRVNSDNDLKVGDIITFYSDSITSGKYSITHRIIEIVNEDEKIYYITKGDNNTDIDDGRITLDNIEGKKVFKLPKLGYVQKFLSSLYGWIIIIMIPSSIYIIYNIIKLIKLLKNKN